ncbi:2,3-bisphosphoglycerate-independent phosphoglycerate mutase [Desulfobaculum xiamenense]|uniref:2,3-bisphosphoglycerate-independent phosphoglycerate mutase n=1 Tax=Desulfobaculum xiamenense TaxID=995050 RepID=A0A846QKZ6_9BACT|nr:cofactor-independent phosphoglycerate mutase [Desulfobaculum xiamenense]NJB68791.1 2,3-bisphosphoglycerate-independent phosphoglycerate mutase [Desulfobaculum xiamenense]
MADTKILFLVADGMGDWRVDGLGGRTPLEAAPTPNMDSLASRCIAGTISTVPSGMPPGSDVANMSLIGFDPAAHHTGRGPIEAAAQGLKLRPDDLVWRLNLVSLTAPDAMGTMLDYSAGHIDTASSLPLVEDLEHHLGDDTFTFVPGIQYRHLLVQRGGANSPEAAFAVRPPHDITGQSIAQDMATLATSPRLLALFHAAAERLNTPANATRATGIWPWGQGRPLALPDFSDAYGLRGAVISAVDLVKGLGRASGMAVIDVPGATGLLDTNYAGKVAAALDFLNTGGQFAFVHLEGPDECGHSGIVADKVEAVRRFDERIVGPLTQALAGTDTAIVVTCDHFTPLACRTHTTDPVPFLLHHASATAHGLPGFSEAHAAATGFTISPGHDIVRRILEIIRP